MRDAERLASLVQPICAKRLTGWQERHVRACYGREKAAYVQALQHVPTCVVARHAYECMLLNISLNPTNTGVEMIALLRITSARFVHSCMNALVGVHICTCVHIYMRDCTLRLCMYMVCARVCVCMCGHV